jgi:hypothetical protein
LTGLLYVHPEAGYFTLLTNAIVLLSTWVPLAVAPLVTSWASIMVVVAIAYVLHHHILHHPSATSDPLVRGAAFAAPILLVAGPASFPEAWANSINLSHYLPVLSFLLVVAFPVDPDRAGTTRLALPFVLAASSPYSALVGMLEWFRPGGLARGRQRVAGSSAIFGLFLQAFVVLMRHEGGTMTDQRPLTLSAERFLDNTAFALASTAVGQARVLGSIAGIESDGSVHLLAYALTAAVAAAVLVLLLSGTHPFFRNLVGGAFFAVTLLVTMTAFQGVGRGRYAVASVGILVVSASVALLSIDQERRRASQRVRAASLMMFALLSTTVGDFWTTERQRFLACEGCPDWAAEVSRVGESGLVEVGIWPYPAWTMTIPARD